MRRAVLLLVLLALVAGCARGRGADSPESALDELRRRGAATAKPRVAAEWLVAELVSNGGDAKQALRARKKLDNLGGDGMLASLARGMDDALHGRLRAASEHHLKAVRAARTSEDPRAPLIAWFAASEALAYRHHSTGLWDDWKRFVEEAIEQPANLGWRARAELVEWWSEEAWSTAKKNVEERSARKFGCVGNLRIAGPFGRGTAADVLRRYPAEAPGPWPTRFPKHRFTDAAPRVLETDTHGCTVESSEPARVGIFYAETYLDVKDEQRVIVAAQGALAVWIDDLLVLERDPREWGAWPRFGVEVTLPPGRHRVLARLTEPVTILRVLRPDGTPAGIQTSADPAPGYSVVPPKQVADPNVLMRYIRPGGVRDPEDDLVRYVAAYLAHVEGQDDVASVLFEPLVEKTDRATGPSLEMAAVFVPGDPIFTGTLSEDLVRRLHESAVKKDPNLWSPQVRLALGDAQKKGVSEAVPRLRELAKQFPEVPAVSSALASLYGQLGWTAEHDSTIKTLAKRFPDDPSWLYAAVEVYDRQGDHAQSDALVARILELDPDSEIELTRALARRDYDEALAEMKRLSERRPDREDLADRVHDVMVRAGNRSETWKKLEAALEEEPKSGRARLDLADAKFAAGDNKALSSALVDAVEAGAETGLLNNAIDLVEGMSELEPFRLDAKEVIANYEKSGVELQGTAARVLDYMAVWVRSDGSSRLLEHEVIRIQSKEAIDKWAEHARLPGLVMHMRVIKKDGRTFEPLEVSGKPTVTFPHLEVGDYIETEQLISRAGDGEHGRRYVGPHWFFREENVAYARSEFTMITPANKELVVETRGNVPKPQIEERGSLRVHRWRVDRSPAAPSEPNSAPATEFLPSVRAGWGIELAERIDRLAGSVAHTTPVDPRIRRIARRHAGPKELAPAAKARHLYRWVLANVEQGDESDGRRVITGKQGNLWRGFMELCRAVGIRVNFGVAKNRLASPPVGSIGRASEFTEPVLRLVAGGKPTWLTVKSKYAPFGYVPAEVRGMPAYILPNDGTAPEKAETPTTGVQDEITYSGAVTLQSNGSADISLAMKAEGKYAMGLRAALIELAERQLHDVIEGRLLGASLRGARLKTYDIEKLDDPDVPLVIRMDAEMSRFAQQSGDALVIVPPFSPRVSQLTALPARQTPLLIGDATRQRVALDIQLPAGARVEGTVSPSKIELRDAIVDVGDRVEDGKLALERLLYIPAGRVQPAEYPKLIEFARKADSALRRNIRIRVK